MMGSICNKPVMLVGAYMEHVEWEKHGNNPMKTDQNMIRIILETVINQAMRDGKRFPFCCVDF